MLENPIIGACTKTTLKPQEKCDIEMTDTIQWAFWNFKRVNIQINRLYNVAFTEIINSFRKACVHCTLWKDFFLGNMRREKLETQFCVGTCNTACTNPTHVKSCSYSKLGAAFIDKWVSASLLCVHKASHQLIWVTDVPLDSVSDGVSYYLTSSIDDCVFNWTNCPRCLCFSFGDWNFNILVVCCLTLSCKVAVFCAVHPNAPCYRS